VEGVDYNHTESILEKVSDNWWLAHATCNFMLCCFVHKDNNDIFTHVTALPAGKTVAVMRLEKAEEISEAHAVAKTTRPVTHGDVEYQMKKARIKGMNSQIDKNNIANIFEQIKMMKDQEDVGDGLWKGYVQVDGTWVDEWTAWAQEATVATRQDRKQ
jgi:hypothetical protein